MRELRRRNQGFSRQARPRYSNLAWVLLCGFVVVLFFFVILGKDNQPSSRQAFAKRSYRQDKILEGLNVTEEMLSPNSITRQLHDQISLAKSLVVIAKESNNLQFAWELSAQIRNSQILLSNAAIRRSPLTVGESESAIRDMALLLYQAQQFHYDSATMIMRLKAKIQTLEEQMSTVNDKSAKYGQIAAEEVPKSMYCLGVRLTDEWFRGHNNQLGSSLANKATIWKLQDNGHFHFCVFSDNILATSVVVNSTAVNSKDPHKVVFHLVTDEVNFAPMKAWFSMNDFRGVTVEVQKIEGFSWLNASYVPVLKQLQDSETTKYYFSGSKVDNQTPIKFRNPKYLSMLNHLRFYIPEVFPALKRVVFLDDDVVVQKDISGLFSIDLNSNVNGAVETCMETFHRYHKYLNYSHPLIRSHFDPDACGWAFGMNVFDLVEWRKRNVTGIYHYWQEKNVDRTLWKLGTLPPGLLTFYGLTEPLDPSWHVLGLGYTNVDPKVITKGAVLHYNGNSKPWLKIGIEKYKPLWDKSVWKETDRKMNDLFSSSFRRYTDLKEQTHLDDLEMQASSAGGGGESANLDKFFEDVENVKEDMKHLEKLYKRLQVDNEECKIATNAKAVKDLRARMDTDVAQVLKRVKVLKSKLENLERSNAANRRLPGCGPGSSTDRTRIAVVGGLGNKLKDMMDDFQALRAKMADEYKETVQRRYFTVTGETADEETIENLISSGQSEAFLQKAIQEQGRGQIMDTVQEIQERHDAIKDIERNLVELHQVFLDMAALVESQGAQLNDIENHVAHASSFVRKGADELQTARKHQKNSRKWTCIAIILAIVLVIVILLPILTTTLLKP